MNAVNLSDFEAMARTALPKPAFDFFAGGAADEITLRENRRGFDELDLYFRVLAGVENAICRSSCSATAWPCQF